MSSSDNYPNSALTVVKALECLDIISLNPQGLGLNEISRQLNKNNSSTVRILEALKQKGFIIQDHKNLRYRLGIKLLELGSIVLSRLNLADIAQPYLYELSNLTEETCHLGILDDCDIIFIAKCEPSNPIHMSTRVGHRCEAACTSLGKAILAFKSETDIEQILEKCTFNKYTNFTIIEQDSFKAELSQIRQDGYAVDNEEQRLGIRCVGAPIYDHNSNICSAVSVAGPSFRLTLENTQDIAKLVVETSKKISSALGYTGE